MSSYDYDAVVVGSGPNGLAASILMQQKGLSVLLLEGKDRIGGGLRTEELTLPGFRHDVCSAIHPMALLSPFFKTLPLENFGLEWIHPVIPLAHPFDDGTAATVYSSIADTAKEFGADQQAYLKLMQPILDQWPLIDEDVLGPFHFPKHPLAMAEFGLKALSSAEKLSRRFETSQLRALWAGLAAHAMLPLNKLVSSAIGLVLLTAAHQQGWPFPKGGAEQLASALAAYFKSLGGKIETNCFVDTISKIPSSRALLFDVTPRQLLHIGGHRFSSIYRSQLNRYRYGMGAFKIDWALDSPIPFIAKACRNAGTIHIGNSYHEIATSENNAWNGRHSERPFILLAQQSLFDPSRAPAGKQTAWAYCHVPNGSKEDMTDRIEAQIERYAPGFRQLILAKHTMNTAQLEHYNPNLVGGDIGGGSVDLGQLFNRPALRTSPYRTSARGMYICSSSTPPGGGVHGMSGYHAARTALKDIFNIKL
jgi:phytoene dehydrogenase-like protein